MNSISVTADEYADQEVGVEEAARVDADFAVSRVRNRVGAAAAAKGKDRMSAAEKVANQRGLTAVVAREAAAKGKDRHRAKITESVAAARLAAAAGEGIGTGRPQRA